MVLLLLAVLALAQSDTASTSRSTPTGDVAGSVDVRLGLDAPRERPSVRDMGGPRPRGVPDRRQSVVYLEMAPRGAFEDGPRPRAVMDQREETFVPYVLPVSVGTTVVFPNNDPFYHNVFSLSKGSRFDLGRYAQGRSRTVTFDRPGVVRVFCEIHSHMSAFILVFSHRFFASTSSSGDYRIEDVPPGEYVVVVWTDGEERVKRRVRVAAGETARLDFVVEE